MTLQPYRPRPALLSLRVTIGGALLATGLLSACGAGRGLADRPTTPLPAPIAGQACDTSNLPGWPRPGQVATGAMMPVLASSERLVGESRLLFTLVDEQGHPAADETLEVEIAFFDLCSDPATPTEVMTPAFAWGVVGRTAFYIATPTLSRAGPWGAAVAVRDPATATTTSAKLQFTVAEEGSTPRVGDPAPAVQTPTLADVGGDVRQVSSDPHPEAAFYETSLDAALAAGEPFLLGFITPGFCTSHQCGPTIEVVKAAVAAAPIRVVIVEPFELAWDGSRLQPETRDDRFVPVEAAIAYGIPTEPWIFLVDGEGTIAASYEAVVGEQELLEAIESLAD